MVSDIAACTISSMYSIHIVVLSGSSFDGLNTLTQNACIYIKWFCLFPIVYSLQSIASLWLHCFHYVYVAVVSVQSDFTPWCQINLICPRLSELILLIYVTYIRCKVNPDIYFTLEDNC